LFPGIAKKLGRHKMEKELVTEITQYLQMKKLYFEVQALKKEKDLPDTEFPGEKSLRAKLDELNEEAAQPKSGLIYGERFKFSMLGAATFFLVTLLLGLISGHSQLKPILIDLGFSTACGLLASFIPIGNKRTSFLYGLTIPIPLVVLYLILTH
jgi:hypothetical protein